MYWALKNVAVPFDGAFGSNENVQGVVLVCSRLDAP